MQKIRRSPTIGADSGVETEFRKAGTRRLLVPVRQGRKHVEQGEKWGLDAGPQHHF